MNTDSTHSDKRFNYSKKLKKWIEILLPSELFLKTSFRILRLKLRQIRIITQFVNYLLVVWHIINLARTRKELRRISRKKKKFPYEDYTAYM